MRSPDRWLLVALAVAAVHGAVVLGAGIVDGPLQGGTAALALLCTLRTLRDAPRAERANRWRWRLAGVGLLAWCLQWVANIFFQGLLAGDYTVPSLFACAARAAIAGALVPLTAVDDGPLFRALDIVQAALFAVLLTALAWPGLITGVVAGPDIGYLYLGYGAMVAIALVAVLTERSPAVRRLIVALLAAQLVYGAGGTVGWELTSRGFVSEEVPILLFADATFLLYLLLIVRPVPARAEHGRRDDFDGSVLPPRLVPALLTVLTVVLAFLMMPVSFGVATAVAGAALLAYAVRAWLTEERFRRAQQQVMATARARIDGLADLMHEVRSPLGLISLNAGLIRRDEAIGAQSRELTTVIQGRCRSITALLDTMLDLERTEAGLAPIEVARIDVGAAVADEVAALRSRAEAQGVAIDPPPATADALADAQALSRILANLLDNALRFTPAGGRVAIGIARSGRTVAVTVSDTGTGLSEEARARLFQRFCPSAPPLHGRRGSGLGLSICRALARAMGGDVQLVTTGPSGTRIRVTLPAA